MQIANILNKMQTSCSEDVQKWAVKNLISKVNCGIVSLAELTTKFSDVSSRLLAWIVNQKTSNDVLYPAMVLLEQLSHITKSELKQHIHEICRYRDECLSKDVQCDILDDILRILLDGNCPMPQPVIRPKIEIQTIPVIQRPKNLEYITYPPIRLTESDEKLLFDLTVQIKFGSQQSILQTLKDPLKRAFKDFPIEIFRSKHELISELVILANSQHQQILVYYALQSLHLFIKRMIKRLNVNKDVQNTISDADTFTSEKRDYINHSFPALNPTMIPLELNQRTLKDLVDMIGIGLLSGFNQFAGQRIIILNDIVALLEKLSPSESATDSCISLITEITKIFDQNDDSLQQQQLVPLYLISYRLLRVLPTEFDLLSISRFCQYMTQAQFSFVFEKEEVQYLIQRLSQTDDTKNYSKILDSLKQYYTNSSLHHEIICLNSDDIQLSYELYRQLLLIIPIAENPIFIKNYVYLLLYVESRVYNTDVPAQDLFLTAIAAPNKITLQIILNTIIQNFSITRQLKTPKGTIIKSIQQLQLSMLKQNILRGLLESAIKQDCYKLYLDLIIEVLKYDPYIDLDVSVLLTRQEKNSSQLLSLIDVETKKLELDLFSLKADKRRLAAKMLLNFSQMNIKGTDFISEIIDETEQLVYHDLLDEQLKHPTFTVDVTIEQLSHLESLCLGNDTKLEHTATQQIVIMLLEYKLFEKDVLRTSQVKSDQMRSYLQYLLENMTKLANDTYQKIQNQQSISRRTPLFHLLGLLFDIFTVSEKAIPQEIALYVIAASDDRQPKYQALRYLHSQLFADPLMDHTNYYKFSSLPTRIDSKNKINYWNTYMPLNKSMTSYIQQYAQFLQEDTSYEQYQQRLFTIKKSNLIQNIDLYLAYRKLNMNCACQNEILVELKQTMLHPEFLFSGNTFILNMIADFDETKPFWMGLLAQVHQFFLETQGQEQLEYLFLYIQLLSVVKEKSDIVKYIIKLLPKNPFNLKVANYIMKLLRLNLMDPAPELVQYLQSNILNLCNKLVYENTSSGIALLSSNLPIFNELEQLEQQILFSRLLQQTQSHISEIRFLAYQQISCNIDQLSKDQIERLTDQLVDSFFSANEASKVYSIILALLVKIRIFNKLPRLVSFINGLLRKEISDLVRAGLFRLLSEFMAHHREEVIPQIQHLAIDLLCIKLKVKDDHSALKAIYQCQIISQLMRQSIGKSLQVTKYLNLVENLLKCLQSLTKVKVQLKFQTALLLDASLMIQFIGHYHNDYLDIEINRVRETKHYASVEACMPALTGSCNIQEKVGIAKLVMALKTPLTDDTILTLCGIYKEVVEAIQTESEDIQGEMFDIVQILSICVRDSDRAKLLVTQQGISTQIVTLIHKELDISTNKKVTSESLRINCIFLKLLYRYQDNFDYSDKFNEVIALTLNLVPKLIQGQYSEYVFEIMANLSTNLTLTPLLLKKLNEAKLLTDLQKYIKSENPLQITIIKILAILGQTADIRLVFVRNKLIEEISEKLIKQWENKKKWNPLTPLNQAVIAFLTSLTFYKDTQERILHQNNLLTILTELLSDQDIESPICQNILIILNNCALNNKLKKTILVNPKLAPITLSLITENTHNALNRFKASQILLNLFYKCTAAVTFFNKPQVFEAIEFAMKDSQRQVDKMRLTTSKLESEREENEQKILYTQQLSNNLNQILKILRIEW